jgi:hypothetical protein
MALSGVQTQQNLTAECSLANKQSLELNSGRIHGCWDLDEQGIYLKRLQSGSQCCPMWEPWLPWDLPELGCVQGDPISTSRTRSTIKNHAYLPDHEEVAVVFSFAGMDLRYRIWVIPGAPGFRLQLGFRFHQALSKKEVASWIGGSCSERLAFDPTGSQGLAVGYYNDTQHRNYEHTPLLRHECWEQLVTKRHVVDWANLISVWRDDYALTLVKESHKCVNQSGIDTGAFLLEPGSIRVTGLGLCDHTYAGGPAWHEFEGWRDAWATWVILSDANERSVQTAVKQMDRCRYPFRPERDELMMCNTWGSGGAGEGSRADSCESVVLRELESAADLGIDLVQIDDGWQCEPEAEHPTRAERDWQPHPIRWPDGWANIRSRAAELGVDLGLWFNWAVDVEKMIRNGQTGGFRRFKLDFLTARTRFILEEAFAKAKTLTETLGPRCGVNWDCTEEMPRMGYFYGREVGNLYLSNRSVGQPRLRHTEYKPHLQLRDAWHLAHFLNLNQFQITVQDVDRLSHDSPHYGKYSHAYAFAIAMPALPILFQLTHQLSPHAREELRPLIRKYRSYRAELHAGEVIPIGREPDGSQWTGFQISLPESGINHLLIFREHASEASEQSIPLPRPIPRNAACEPLDSNDADASLSLTGEGITVSSTSPACFLWARTTHTLLI